MAAWHIVQMYVAQIVVRYFGASDINKHTRTACPMPCAVSNLFPFRRNEFTFFSQYLSPHLPLSLTPFSLPPLSPFLSIPFSLCWSIEWNWIVERTSLPRWMRKSQNRFFYFGIGVTRTSSYALQAFIKNMNLQTQLSNVVCYAQPNHVQCVCVCALCTCTSHRVRHRFTSAPLESTWHLQIVALTHIRAMCLCICEADTISSETLTIFRSIYIQVHARIRPTNAERSNMYLSAIFSRKKNGMESSFFFLSEEWIVVMET